MSDNKKRDFTIYQILAGIGSILVIVSFFTPWFKSFFGSVSAFKLVIALFKSIEDFDEKTLLLLIFLLSPIVCHILFLNKLSKKYSSKTLTIIPLAIWILFIAISFIKASGEPSFIQTIIKSVISETVSFGPIGTLIGMIFTYIIVCYLSNQNIETVEQKVVQYCPNCGTKIEKDAVFCPECGTEIKDS